MKDLTMIQPADLIITNAKCFTADPGQPRAEAMAVQANRIALVGSAQEVEALRGPRTRVVDGQGGTLIPGFIDSHYHLLTSSLELDHADLSQVSTPRELTAAIGEYTRRNLDRQWLIGVGLPYQVLPNNQPLTRHHLDALVADRPLIVFAYDAHTVWANTEALRRANLLQGKQTVGPNSQIVMGEDGLATGELREMGAYHHVLALLPAASDPEKRRLLRIGLQQAAELGITSVHNMDGDAQQLAFYSTLDDLGELTLRVYCPLRVKQDTTPEARAEAVAMRRDCQGDEVRGGWARC